MPALNPQTVLASSKCFACLGASLSDLLILGLWDDISQGGSTPVDPYDGVLVYTRQGLGTTTVVNPGGAFNLTFALNKVTEVHCHNCPLITGLNITGSNVLTVVDFQNCPALTSWMINDCDALLTLDLSFMVSTSDVQVLNCQLLQSIDFSNLTSGGVGVGVGFNPTITSLSFPSLAGSITNLHVYENAGLLTVSAPLIENVLQLAFRDNPSVTSWLLPSLVTCNEVNFQNSLSATSISLPSLSSTDNFNAPNCPLLATVSLPDLASVTNIITITTCPSLESFDLPSYSAFVPVEFYADNCTILEFIGFNSQLFTDGGVFQASNCSLLQSSVDLLLASAAPSMTSLGGYIDLSGGTNSAPTGGAANPDYVTLVGNGVTVLIN